MDDDPACPGVPWVPQRLLSLLNIAQHAVLGLEFVRQAWRVARKRKRGGCGGHYVDLGVKVPCRP